MSLRVYNTPTRQKELFEPVRPGKVGMYLCGPTVYKPPHIGHLVGPIIFDAIKRYLKFKGFGVTWIVNITDVDDKLIEAAARQNTTMAALVERYTREYMECIARLGIDGIDRFPKATEHIPEIISICKGLIDKGCAYVTEGSVYFDVSKDPSYGKLSHRRVDEQEAGTRDVEQAAKRHPADFALWKASKPSEPAWDSPWGRGRPGWHIECSAMSMKYLGPTFDIHGGGLDLVFPHHENELAQSETLTGEPFVKYWLHNGLTRVRTKSTAGQWRQEDMHASAGNVVDAQELLAKYGPELLRYMLLGTHYRSPIEFSDEVLAAARKGLSTFVRLRERIERIAGAAAVQSSSPDLDQAAAVLITGPAGAFVRDVLSLQMKFLEMMDDDFNTAGAIAVLHEMATTINGFIESHGIEKEQAVAPMVDAVVAAWRTLGNLGRILGLFRAGADAPAGQDMLVPKLVGLLLQLRQEARAAKNFALADSIRQRLAQMGVILEDRTGGTEWRREP